MRNYRRCDCEWCNPKAKLFPLDVSDPDDIRVIAREVLESSGPFNDSDVVHTLALAVLGKAKAK